MEYQPKKSIKNNISQKQKQALRNIRENENIIIKEADKGSAVVIFDKTYYKTKIQEILNDETNNRYKHTQ